LYVVVEYLMGFDIVLAGKLHPRVLGELRFEVIYYPGIHRTDAERRSLKEVNSLGGWGA
jgi:hypothetical protein